MISIELPKEEIDRFVKDAKPVFGESFTEKEASNFKYMTFNFRFIQKEDCP